MNKTAHNLVGAVVALLAVASSAWPAPESAVSDGGSLNHSVQGYRGLSLEPSFWTNLLSPEASGDFIAQHPGTSADAQFMRSIAFYTRDMLDRGGWVNPYAPDDHYAVGNELLAVRVGEGLTVRAPV